MAVKRWLLGSGVTAGCTAVAMVWAIHTRPDFGPWLANSVRAMVGPEWVALGEDTYYTAQDQLNVWLGGNATPVQMWQPNRAKIYSDQHRKDTHRRQATSTPNQPAMAVQPAPSAVQQQTAQPLAPTPVVSLSPESPAPVVLQPAKPVFLPANFAPPVPEVAVLGDGRWEAWAAGPDNDTDNPLLYRTQVHPDPARPQAVVAVVAIDLRRLELKSLPGVSEPASQALSQFSHRGLVPLQDRPALVAAFNGGWQAIHGHLGMKSGGIELLPPRPQGCTVAAQADGRVRIATWTDMASEYDSLRWMRQTPPCLLENGQENAQLDSAKKRWGAALSGATVVRRSALGINADGTVLYYAIGDSLTAAAIARAVAVAGATTAAMLDINYSFPRFVTFNTQPDVQGWEDHLPPDMNFSTDMYLNTPAVKDFFYLTLRQEPATVADSRLRAAQ